MHGIGVESEHSKRIQLQALQEFLNIGVLRAGLRMLNCKFALLASERRLSLRVDGENCDVFFVRAIDIRVGRRVQERLRGLPGECVQVELIFDSCPFCLGYRLPFRGER